MADRVLTMEEEKAVASLRRLAKRWPCTLTLASMGGSLFVLPSDYGETASGGIDPDDVIESIPGIPNTGGDW